MTIHIAHIFIVYPHKYQSYNVKLIERQRMNGLRCTVFSFSKAKGAGVHYLHLSFVNRILFFFRAFKYFHLCLEFRRQAKVGLKQAFFFIGKYAAIKRARPDVVHVHHAQVLSDNLLLFLKLINVPWVISLRGYETILRPVLSEADRQFTLNSFNKTHGIHAVSESLREKAISMGISPDKITTIRRTPEEEKLIDPKVSFDSREIQVTTIGRFNWVKGVVYAIQAIKLLVDSGHTIIFNVVGDGSTAQQEEVRYWTSLLKLEKYVTIHGYLDSDAINLLLSKTHIYVQPSINEGIPNTIVRAVTNKIPIVASDVGGIPEVVKNGENGILVPPGSPLDIAKAIERIIADKELRDRIRNSSLHNIHFDPAIEIKSYIAFYKEIMDKFMRL